MQRSDEIIKTKFGRQVTIRKDVRDWSKRMKRYRELKAPLLAFLATMSKEDAVTWLNTPRAGRMLGRTPKEMFHPYRIQVLYKWWLTQCRTM